MNANKSSSLKNVLLYKITSRPHPCLHWRQTGSLSVPRDFRASEIGHVLEIGFLRVTFLDAWSRWDYIHRLIRCYISIQLPGCLCQKVPAVDGDDESLNQQWVSNLGSLWDVCTNIPIRKRLKCCGWRRMRRRRSFTSIWLESTETSLLEFSQCVGRQ